MTEHFLGVDGKFIAVDGNLVTLPSLDGRFQNKNVTPTTETQIITADESYIGLDSVTVDAIQTEQKTITPSTAAQVIIPTNGKFLSQVTVGAVQTENKNIIPSTNQQTITAANGKFLSSVIVESVPTEEKIVIPSENQQIIVPTSGKFISKVTVDRIYAIISVTYPEGSVCTCSDRKTTLTARDTSGKALFNVSAGEWTVTATDGNKTKSATVSITQEAQSESVTLSYWNGEFYERGNQYTNITGGWQKTGAGTFSLNTSDMIIGPANYGSNVRGTTKNKVDISGYSSLEFTYTCTNGNAYVRAGIATITSPSDDGGWVSYVGFSTTSSEKVATLDVSSLTGSYYIVVSTFTADPGDATINIKKVQGV